MSRLVYVNGLQQRINPSHSTMLSNIVRSLSVTSRPNQNKNGVEETKSVQLFEILNHEEGFKLFANHLLKEFSVLSAHSIFCEKKYIKINLCNYLLFLTERHYCFYWN